MQEKSKFKLICFDLDGTIVDETISVWQTIHDHVGSDKEKVKKATEDYYNKKINFKEWVDHDIKLWRDMGVTRTQLMEAIAPLRLMPGALGTLRDLKDKGYKLAIISGSLDIVLDQVFPDYELFFDHIFISRMFFDEEGKIKSWEAVPSGANPKVEELKIIAEEEEIDIQECIFIGDHENDIDVSEIAGFSIAFNCKSEKLAQIADVLIEKKDLREILHHIK